MQCSICWYWVSVIFITMFVISNSVTDPNKDVVIMRACWKPPYTTLVNNKIRGLLSITGEINARQTNASTGIILDDWSEESFISKDLLLRRVGKLLNLEFLYDLTEELYCLDNGRAYIDPVLFFRMQLISYLFRIESDRQLCRDIHLDLAYRRNGQNIERTKLSILL